MTESTYARQRRDERTAAEATAPDARSLMCRADGCPNRWAVDGGNGRCCSAHAWATTHLWPSITRQQQDAETDRAWRAQRPIEVPTRPVSREQRAAAIEAVRALFSARPDHLAGARRLRQAELHNDGVLASGERMTKAQREFWRTALQREGWTGSASAAQPQVEALPEVLPEAQVAAPAPVVAADPQPQHPVEREPEPVERDGLESESELCAWAFAEEGLA